MRIFDWFRDKRAARRAALMFEREVIVTADDAGISVAYPSGKIWSMAWADVDRVAIETNDSGPWGADYWWLLEGKHGRCAYPQGATGEIEALKLLPSRFEGFSDEQVGRANRCTSNARFVCWERKNAL